MLRHFVVDSIFQMISNVSHLTQTCSKQIIALFIAIELVHCIFKVEADQVMIIICGTLIASSSKAIGKFTALHIHEASSY